MKSTWRAIVLPFLSVFLVIGITLSFTVELGLWHHPNWSAIGSGASAVAALVASLAVLMAVLGLRKAEKSARINVVKDIEDATREVLYSLAEVRTEVYKCVRIAAEVENTHGRDASRNLQIPIELKSACMKLCYSLDLLYLRKIDFTGKEKPRKIHIWKEKKEKYPATADVTGYVLILSWLSRRLLWDFGTTVSINRKEFRKFFKKDFVNEKGKSWGHIVNPRTLDLIIKEFDLALKDLLKTGHNPEINEKEPLFILVVAELMDRFSYFFVLSFKEMVSDLKIGFADIFEY